MRIPETKEEKIAERMIEMINSKMNLNIVKADISAAYRVGQKVDSKPRHIVVTFKENALKMRVYNNKRSLKGSKAVIKEDLTPLRLRAMKTTAEKYGFKNVWSVNGAIFAKTEHGVDRIKLN
nr:unnamed protein product [Callosobruchus chinensis]